MTLPTPELASEMLAALLALYEACERRANEEGGDFGDDIGAAAELADAAISKAALLDSLPSPVSVGDAREIAKRLVAESHYGVMTNEQLEDTITAALLSAESRGEHKMRERAREAAVKKWRDFCVTVAENRCAALEARVAELEGERDTATRALAVLDHIAWLAAEEDSWLGNENDIAVQRAAAERHRAALSKTEGKG